MKQRSDLEGAAAEVLTKTSWLNLTEREAGIGCAKRGGKADNHKHRLGVNCDPSQDGAMMI